MALLLVIALLSLPCPSIRAELTRREHAQDRLLNTDRVKVIRSPAWNRRPFLWNLAAPKKDAEHERPKPQPEGGGISPSGPGVARSRYGEMLPS